MNTYCHDCARPTKGNYSQCEVCGAPICDACDSRLLHPNSCYCHDHLPSKRGYVVTIEAHCPAEPGTTGDAADAFSSTFTGEAGRVIDWAYQRGEEAWDMSLPCTLKVDMLITEDASLADMFRDWAGFKWTVKESHFVLIPGNYAMDDFFSDTWIEENKA